MSADIMKRRSGSALFGGEEEKVRMLHPRYTSQEIARRGEEIYAKQIRDRVEAKHKGRFLVH
jgi:hypothetical protein